MERRCIGSFSLGQGSDHARAVFLFLSRSVLLSSLFISPSSQLSAYVVGKASRFVLTERLQLSILEGRKVRFLPAAGEHRLGKAVDSAGVTCPLTAREGWDFLIDQLGHVPTTDVRGDQRTDTLTDTQLGHRVGEG